ncbi:aldose 1-epimerase family protein [Streptomyces sp. NBC_00885]|uniref:aldose 1-epimerase family protein n=1 Tax=Streptomyces sp. NBC_00885 TaxID=2975857 RepID=UPI00386EF607|nr:aldose 1-epimerase family protein [Streptomyces sp. NBC_00885]
MQESRTGQQLTLRHGPHTAVVVELGAALRSYTVGERAVIDGFAAQGRITGGRGQILVPWPNRIRDGRYRWNGQEHQLPLTEPAGGNALHGLLRWVSWRVVESSDSRAALAVQLWPQPGYPFHLHVLAEYTLGEGGLEVAVTARNLCESAAPYGFGQHPYVMAGTAVVDEAVLTVPARTRLRTDERGLPVAAEPVAGTAYDLRAPHAVGARRLDTPFGDLDRDADGRAVVRLAHPSGAFGTDVWLGEGADYVQLYTGDTLPPGERRRAVAVEPMTCPPDAFRSGTGLVSLGPGERHTVRWGITPWGE